MAEFRPTAPFSVTMILFSPTYETINGVRTKKYDENAGILFNGSFQTYGGTETTVNGVYSVEDTANITTWYMPEIKSNCRIKVLNTGAAYDIIGEPEDINMRKQFIKFKVKRVKGNA